MKNHRPWFPDLRLWMPGSPSAWKPNGQCLYAFIHPCILSGSCSHSCFQKSNFPAIFCSLNHYLRHPGLDTKWRASPLNGLLLRPRWTAFMWYHVIVLLYMIMWWFLSWCFAQSHHGVRWLRLKKVAMKQPEQSGGLSWGIFEFWYFWPSDVVRWPKWLMYTNVGKTMIKNHIFDGLYHPFMVILGMVYYGFNHIIVLESYFLLWDMFKHLISLEDTLQKYHSQYLLI